MTDADDKPDPIVLRALRRLEEAQRRPVGATLCPRCGRREVPEGADWCEPCAREHALEVRERKRLWAASQDDYDAQREKVGATEAAARWLAERLRRYDGACDSAQLRAEADEAGIPYITLRRGRDRLRSSRRLVVEREGMPKGRSRWRLTTLHERDHMLNQRPKSTRSEHSGAQRTRGAGGPV